MKRLLLNIGIYTGLLIMLAACSHQSASLIPEDWSDRSTVRIYEVFGMDCPGCHGGIEKQVNALDGVIDSRADWTTKQVTILVDSSVNVTDVEIHAAIERANFTPGKRIQ